MFKELCIKHTPHLWFTRSGWFATEYQLTDGTDIYGVLNYEWFSRNQCDAQTAAHQWHFSFWSLFSRELTITDGNGEVIGSAERELFSNTYTLNLKSGFRARFYRPSIFSRRYLCESEGYGPLITIENNFPFGLNNDVYIEESQAPASVIPLLIFFGMHLTIYRRGRRKRR
ncbi:hypothetical protein ACFS5N_06250 [Mucilaginibacter ximonensis]|uniref:Uncharacterized protein n=1 Tax=Mucilaginibacter ximonensis TaxID=538021 RepID=A0ABW5YAP8_9SPHI